VRVAVSVLIDELWLLFCALLQSQQYQALKEKVCQMAAHHDELECKLKTLRQSREEKERNIRRHVDRRCRTAMPSPCARERLRENEGEHDGVIQVR